MKKSVLALILFAVLVIIVSPGIIGKLAEESVSDNLNRVAAENGELIITTDGFKRGWFSSEGQHRVEIGNGGFRSAVSSATDGLKVDETPVLIINTHIDHGLIPLSSMSREEGSLSPGLGSAVSTLTLEVPGGESIDLPGAIYSELGLGGNLTSRYTVGAGSHTTADGEVTWQASTIHVAASSGRSGLEFDGTIGPMSFGNDYQGVSVDGLTFVGSQTNTPYGFQVGDIDMNMGAMTVAASYASPVGGIKAMGMKGSSSVDDGLVTAAMRYEISGMAIPNFGDVSLIADVDFGGIDAVALGALSKRLDELSATQDPFTLMTLAEGELNDLLSGGININVDQFDVALPMGTVTSRMSFEVPESDNATFEWTSLLLDLVGEVYVVVPEELVQLATSLDPQAAAIVGMGYLKKEGRFYVMDARMKKGLLTVNGAPIPISLGAFQ